MEYLISEGYWCWQSRGSRGPADIVAIKPGQVLLVQVKGGVMIGNISRFSHDEWNVLLALAQEAGAVPIAVDWPRRGRMRLREITGYHQTGTQEWPSKPFLVDVVVPGSGRP